MKRYKKRLAILYKSYILASLFFVVHLCPAGEKAYPLGSWKYKENETIKNLALDRALKLEKGSLIDDRRVSEALSTIEALYKSKGYCFVQLEVEKDISPEGEVDLTFFIAEGRRTKIRNVFFEGNQLIPSAILMECVENKKGLFVRKIYTEQAVQEDVERINQYYLNNAIQGRVVQIRKDFVDQNEAVNLTYCIEERIEQNQKNDLAEAGVVENPFEKMETEKPQNKEDSANKDSKQITVKREALKPDKTAAIIIKNAAVEGKVAVVPERAFADPEIVRLKDLLKGREEVESLLSNMLTEEKEKAAKIIQDNNELKEKVKSLEEKLFQQSKAEQELRSQLENKSMREKEILAVKNGAEKKLQNVNALITTKLKDIEKIKDQLQFVLTDTADAIAKELDRVELQEVTITPQKEAPVKIEKAVEKTETEQTVKSIEKKSLQGKVLVVNSDLNFIVFNIGAEKGSSKGMFFSIERNGKSIGRCRVIEARKNISAADVIEKTAPVKTGDYIYEQNN